LDKIARTEFFRRQSVIPFADRQEQLHSEAGRWVKGGTCDIKESVICGEACHWSHLFSWKVSEICAAYRRVVPSALAAAWTLSFPRLETLIPRLPDIASEENTTCL
jgi:hypothetical protein